MMMGVGVRVARRRFKMGAVGDFSISIICPESLTKEGNFNDKWLQKFVYVAGQVVCKPLNTRNNCSSRWVFFYLCAPSGCGRKRG